VPIEDLVARLAATRARVHPGVRFAALGLSLVLSAGGGNAPVEPGVPAPRVETEPIQDENNYRATSKLSIPTIETAPSADLEICWDGLVNDLLCHDVTPEVDIDTVGLLRLLRLTEDDVEARLSADDLPQSAVDGYVEHLTDHEATCARLSAFSFFGTEIDLAAEYVETDGTYMLLFSTGTKPGVGARSMTFIRPTAESDNTSVNVAPGCDILDFTADIASAVPLTLPSEGPWAVDWRSITTTGLGSPVPTAGIDSALIGFYEAMTVADSGLPAERRALVGVVRCLVATGDRSGAEAIYRRLMASGATEPDLLAQARTALRASNGGHGGGGESALPGAAR
jgi:hypothetical protein